MYHAFAEACYSVPNPRGNGVKWTGVTIVPANRAAQLARVEPQYWNYVDESDAVTSVLGAVGDAARSGGAT